MNKELILIIIFLRVVPILLLRRIKSNKILNRFIVLFSFCSFISDFTSFLLVSNNMETKIIVSLYTFFQPYLVFSIILNSFSFKRNQILVLWIFNLLLSISILYFTIISPDEFIMSIIWGISHLLFATECWYVIVKILLDIRVTNPEFPEKTLPIFGLFIYASFSIIPLVSHFMQVSSTNKLISAQLYLIFMLSGNFVRDIFFSIYALLLIKAKKYVKMK